MMKFRNTFLLCSFFVHAAVAVPMFRAGDERPSREGYASLDSSEQQEEMDRRGRSTTDLEKSADPDEQQRSSSITRAFDPTIKIRQEVWVDSSDELLNEKTKEAQGVAEKWSLEVYQKSGPVNLEEITAILKDANRDYVYWNSQENKTYSWVSADDLDLATRTRFINLFRAAGQAKQAAYNAILLYSALSESQEGTAGSTLPPVSLNVRNPLVSEDAHLSLLPSPRKIEPIRIPSKSNPLAASSLMEVLSTWSKKAEIRYDATIRKYLSEQEQADHLFSMIGRTIARSSIECKQHRAAIKKIALEAGTERASGFLSHQLVRMQYFFGGALTPGLINRIQRDLDYDDVHLEDIQRAESHVLSTVSNWLENLVARLESFRRSRNSEYQEIP